MVETDDALQRRARRMQRDGPGLVADDPVGRDPSPCLEGFNRRLGVRPEDAIDAEAEVRRPPQSSLQPPDDRASSAGGDGGLAWVRHLIPPLYRCPSSGPS